MQEVDAGSAPVAEDGASPPTASELLVHDFIDHYRPWRSERISLLLMVAGAASFGILMGRTWAGRLRSEASHGHAGSSTAGPGRGHSVQELGQRPGSEAVI
jgi:hypothetical protein